MDALFEVHRLNEDGLKKASDIAELFNSLITDLGQFCPPGREMEIVRTKLEEACFFAKKSMANETNNQA